MRMSGATRRRLAASLGPSLFNLEPCERRLLLVGTITGTVYSDYNSNGVQDGSEPGLAGWTVYIDANNNNLPEPAEQQRTTDANGQYSFANLTAPAQYIIREVLQGGWVQTVPGSGGVILDGTPTGPTGDPNAGRPFTLTEIVVAFDGTSGLPALRQAVNNNASLRRLVDITRSQDMFTVSGTTLVEVKLPRGADPLNVVARFKALPNVAWAQPNYIYVGDPRELTPNDPSYASQYHHPLMKNNLAWDITQGDPRVIIASTDDGVDFEHQDLYINLWINQPEIPPTRLANLTDLNSDGYISMEELQDPSNRGPFKANDINGDNRITGSDLLAAMIKDGGGNDTGNGGWSDGIDQGSNTFVDDLVGRDVWSNDNDARPASGFSHGTHVAGIASARTNNAVGVAGTAGRTSILPLRFYSGSGWTSTHVSNAYRYGTNNGAQIITTSYNVDQFTNDSVFGAAVQYMYDNGVLHFNSAGNNGQLNPPRQKWDQSLFVVNTQSNDTKSSSSNYGWGVDLTAPGTSILSTYPNNSYQSISGTSMSTPNAAGVAGLIWALHPEWTRDQVAAQLIATCDNIDAVNPSFVGLLGGGRANSFRSLTETIPPPRVKSMTNFPAEGSFTLTKPTLFNFDSRNVWDPTTVSLSSFELRGDGIDNIFNTGDDVLIPMTQTFGSGNFANYMIGNNRMNFTVPGAMAPDRYRFSALPVLKDPFGQSIDGDGNGTGGDAFTRTFTLLAASNQFIVNLPDGQTISTANFGNHDIAPPKSLSSQFTFQNSQSLVVQFNENVSASLSMADLVLENLTAGGNVDTSGFTLSYDSLTNTATFSVNGILPDADFRARLVAGGIQDLSGNTLDGNGNGVGGDDHTFDFFFLQGDANRDRRVDLLDFDILAANFGASGTNFSQANFNYDGQTDLTDFNIFTARFGGQLAGPSSLSFGQGDSRMIDDVMGGSDDLLS
jgi:subtilisin family serine protease